MTFREVKAELARYSAGPGARLTVKQVRRGGWFYGGSKSWSPKPTILRFRLEVDRPCVDDPERQTEITSDSYLPLYRCYPANICHQVVDCWHGLWEHELHEWLRKDGATVFDPHGVRHNPMGSPGRL